MASETAVALLPDTVLQRSMLTDVDPTPAGLVRNLFFDSFRSVFPWTGLILYGMWLGRIDLLNPLINRRVFAAGVSVAIVAGAGSVREDFQKRDLDGELLLHIAIEVFAKPVAQGGLAHGLSQRGSRRPSAAKR